MTKNAEGVLLKKSKLTTNGKPNLPAPSKLAEGELAINYAEGVETISTKNESGTVVTFSSDDYFKNQYLAWEKGTGTGSAKIVSNSGTASGDYSVSEGEKTIASGSYSHAEGYGTTARTYYSHAEGLNTIASGQSSHAEGYQTSATNIASHAEGYGTTASGSSSHAEGLNTLASGESSHAEGFDTKASGNYSHSEGCANSATSESSHAEGQNTYAYRKASHAEGQSTQAIGDLGSHAEGYSTIASGISTHAEGYYSKAFGDYSHAEGYQTKALNRSEHSCGQNNISSSASTTFGDSGNTLFSVGNGTADDARHNAFEIRQNGDIYIVSGDTDILLQDYLGGGITVDQVIDSGTSASTNAVATHAVYDVIVDNEMVWANAFAVLSGVVSSHTENTTIHVTASDKTNWDGKLDATAYTPTDLSNYYQKSETSGKTELTTAFNLKANVSDLNAYFDDAKYEDSGSTKVINFYHGSTIKATIDASDFIKDGMIDDVRIENGYLVIDFNTASGKQDISIPLTDIFDPSNYYTKSETSGATEIATALTQKLAISDFNTYSGGVNTTINSKASQSDLNTLSGTVTGHTANTGIHLTSTQKENIDSLETNIDAISGITSTDITNWDNAATDSHTHSNKTALDSITGNVGTMAYEATTSYSSATDVNTALGNKLGTSEFNTYSGAVDTAIGSKAAQSDLNSLSGAVTSHTADNSIHLSSTEKTNLDSLAANIAAISGITSTKVGNWDTAATNTHSHSNTAALNSITGNVGTMAYEATISYSSATDVNTALSGKSDTGHTHDDRYYTESELTGSSTTVVVAKAASATTAATAAVANSVALSNVSGADDIKAIEALTGISGLLKKTAANTWALDTTSYSSATQVNTALSGKSNTGHTHDASGVTAMTGYQIASSSASVLSTDSLLQTIGKLEKRIAILEAALGGMTLVKLTSAQYEALTTKDPNTMYIIND